MSKCVLDASAVTAVLRKERGHDKVIPRLRGSLISTVNLAEVFCNARSYGSDPEHDEMTIRDMQVEVVPFDHEQARIVSCIFTETLGSTVGIADRVCMALGLLRDLPVLTGDHHWQKHDIGVKVELFRKRKAA